MIKLTVPRSLVILFILLVSVLSGMLVHHFEHESEMDQVSYEISHLENEIIHEFEELESNMALVSSLYQSSEKVTFKEYTTFSKPIFKRFKEIRNLTFLPKINKKDIAQFEVEMSKELGTPFRVRSIGQNETSFVFPLTLMQPFEKNIKALGVDVYSIPKEREAVDRAIETKKFSSVGPKELVQDKTKDNFQIYIYPIFKNNSILGLVGVVLDVEVYIKRVLVSEQRTKFGLKLIDLESGKEVFNNLKTKKYIEREIVIQDRKYKAYWEKDHKNVNIGHILAVSLGLLNFLFLMFIYFIFLYLQEVNKREKKASKEKSLFLAKMSHEIRTPLNGILGSVDLLLKKLDSKDEKELAHDLAISSNRLKNTITDILDFTQIERGALKFESSDFHFKNEVMGSCDVLKREFKERGNVFKLLWDDSCPEYVKGDKRFIGQIIINLLANANKFTKDGLIELEVKRKDKDLYHFEVRDTGVGIMSEELKEITKAFKQGRQHQSDNRGIGLGLSISSEMIKIMGGKLDVRSSYAEGSVFGFDLHLKSAAPTISPKVAPNVELSQEIPLKILIVEDDPVNQRMAKRFLEKMGYKSDLAEDGKQGLIKASKNNYDLILMDIQMPVMDGITSTKRILEHNRENPPIIIALTADTTSLNKEKCFEAGMVDFITKPFKQSVLTDAIRKHCSKK